MSGWFVVDPSTGQPVGPYDTIALQGLIAKGFVQQATPLWREGEPEWLQLQQIEELRPLLAVAQEVAKAVKNKGASGEPEDELAAFHAEIVALEASAAEEAAAAEGQATPEELEFEDDDGTEYVWDKALRKYMPKNGGVGTGPGSDAGYDLEAMTYAADEEVIPSLHVAGAEGAGDEGGADERKRKASEAGPSTAGDEAAKGPAAKRGKKGKGKAAPPPPPAEWFDLKNNTSVYVTGLPTDVTVEEVSAVFSKYGLIKELDSKTPRIKLYRDKQTGALKGDGLVTYLKEPSVALAVQLLDGAPFRPDSKVMMTVAPAKFEMKGQAYQPKVKQPMSKRERKFMLEKQEKLLAWAGFDDRLPAEKVTVILHHMFTAGELEDAAAVEELEKEVALEAGKLGPVEKVRVFKDHPEGVVSVRFKTAEGAAACVERMNGRFFGGLQLVAHMWDGLVNYASAKVKESAEEQEARLEAYAREVEERAKARAAADAAAAAAAAGDVGPEARGPDSAGPMEAS